MKVNLQRKYGAEYLRNYTSIIPKEYNLDDIPNTDKIQI